MSFNSLEFLLFLLCFLLIWNKLLKTHLRVLILSLFSIVFYGWNQPWILLLLFASSVANYCCGARIQSGHHKTGWLGLSLILNIGILIYFKFFHLGEFPMGISFYTFQSLSYCLDLYLNRGKTARNFLHFFSFVSMFPQLVAGPICRGKELLEKILRPIDKVDYELGFYLIIQGYFKKVFLADHFAILINPIFSTKLSYLDSVQSWILIIAYGWQIYFDFSGYTDIARGIGKCMGIELPDNFLKPYSAISLRDFWRRWHITLSTWFRDYVFIPLGGSKQSSIRTYGSILVTMILSGIWHGSGVNFVLWGIYHGGFLCLEKILEIDFKYKQTLVINYINQFRTYMIVIFGWAIFRISDFTQLKIILKKLVVINIDGRLPQDFKYIIALTFISFICENMLFTQERKKFTLLITLVFLLLVIFFRQSPQEFIYYRF